MTTITQIQAWARDSLKAAQELFNETPNSTYWNIMLRASLVHQQAWQLTFYSNKEGTDKLLETIDSLDKSKWPDAICRAGCGMGIEEALDS